MEFITKKILFALAIAVGLPLAAYAQGMGISSSARPSENIMPDTVIELKDGARIIHDADGIMYHVDEKGRRLTMAGKMEAKDGSVYIMRNGYVWKRIETGTRPHTP